MNSLRVNLLPILIVDDNDDDFEAIVRAFKKSDIVNPVSRCRRGSDVIEFLKNTRPLFILLDLNMSGMDGYAILRMIKEDARLRRIPAIIWSTSSNDRDVDACYQTGANAYMQKPSTFEGLMDAVRCLKEYWLGKALLPGNSETG